MTTTSSSCDMSFTDVLIRFEDVLLTANCGLTTPVAISEGQADLTQQIATTRVCHQPVI